MGKLYSIEDYENLVFGRDSQPFQEEGEAGEQGENEESKAEWNGGESGGEWESKEPEEEWLLEDAEELDSLDGEWQPEQLPPEVLQDLGIDDFPPLTVNLVMEDGVSHSYEIMGVFQEDGFQYMALHPAGGAQEGEIPIELMRFTEGEQDALVLEAIETKEEYVAAEKAFYRLLGDA